MCPTLWFVPNITFIFPGFLILPSIYIHSYSSLFFSCSLLMVMKAVISDSQTSIGNSSEVSSIAVESFTVEDVKMGDDWCLRKTCCSYNRILNTYMEGSLLRLLGQIYLFFFSCSPDGEIHWIVNESWSIRETSGIESAHWKILCNLNFFAKSWQNFFTH